MLQFCCRLPKTSALGYRCHCNYPGGSMPPMQILTDVHHWRCTQLAVFIVLSRFYSCSLTYFPLLPVSSDTPLYSCNLLFLLTVFAVLSLQFGTVLFTLSAAPIGDTPPTDVPPLETHHRTIYKFFFQTHRQTSVQASV